MEESLKKKGTVTPISSLFSPEETQKASEHVRDAIVERHKQLDVLKGFISDNTKLINLVQTLPDELEHQIMVPFGKAAFFPGRLIHTNELMVLLGDGYYTERTAKQTVEILKRRQKVLESQVESAKADIQDLRTEASFFDATADEAASGVVQIVEDYAEERPFHEASNADGFPSSSEAEQKGTSNEDDEYERIFSRMAELEKEEEAAEDGDEDEPNEDDFRPIVFQQSDARAPSNRYSSAEDALQQNVPHLSETKDAVPVQPSQPRPDSSKAFTGSIVERTHNLVSNPREETVARSSKPVSRFKMNRK